MAHSWSQVLDEAAGVARAHADLVAERFDRLCWLTIGQTPNLRRLLALLGDRAVLGLLHLTLVLLELLAPAMQHTRPGRVRQSGQRLRYGRGHRLVRFAALACAPLALLAGLVGFRVDKSAGGRR